MKDASQILAAAQLCCSKQATISGHCTRSAERIRRFLDRTGTLDKWKELGELLDQECGEFNKEPKIGKRLLMVDRSQHPCQFVIRRTDSQKSITAKYDQKKFSVHFSGDGIKKTTELIKLGVIDGTREVCFFDPLNGTPIQAIAIVDTLLDAMLYE